MSFHWGNLMPTSVLRRRLTLTLWAARVCAPCLGLVVLWFWRALVPFFAIAAAILLLAQLGRLLGRPPKPTLRLMELAAFAWLAIDLSYAAIERNGYFDALKNSGVFVPRFLGPLYAVAYCASIFRLFLWEWYIEENAKFRIPFATLPGMRYATNNMIRLVVWLILLSSSIQLRDDSIPWPRFLVGMRQLDAHGGLLITNAMLAIWAAFMYQAAPGSKVRRLVSWWLGSSLLAAAVTACAMLTAHAIRGGRRPTDTCMS